eukprot:UN21068
MMRDSNIFHSLLKIRKTNGNSYVKKLNLKTLGP